MIRRVFRILWGFELVLFVAVASLWVRSYWRTDRLIVNLSDVRQIGLASQNGTFFFAHTKLMPGPGNSFQTEPGYQSMPSDAPGLDIAKLVGLKLGIFPWMSFSMGFGSFFLVGIPAWLLCMVLALPFGIWTLRRRRRQSAHGRGFAVESPVTQRPDPLT